MSIEVESIGAIPDNLEQWPVVEDNSSESQVAKRVQKAAKPVINDISQVARLLPGIEQIYMKRIHERIEHVDDLQATTKKLLELSRKFSAHVKDHKNDKEAPLAADLLEVARTLEEKGIHILDKGEMAVSIERVNDLKSQIQAEIDRLKSDIQIEFSTGVQTKISELQSIYECLKIISKQLDRMMGAFVAGQQVR